MSSRQTWDFNQHFTCLNLLLIVNHQMRSYGKVVRTDDLILASTMCKVGISFCHEIQKLPFLGILSVIISTWKVTPCSIFSNLILPANSEMITPLYGSHWQTTSPFFTFWPFSPSVKNHKECYSHSM